MSEPGAVTPPAYPADLEREIALWDGTRLRLRPIPGCSICWIGSPM